MFIVCSWPNECLRVCVCMLLHLMLLPTLCNFQTCSNPFSTQNETDFTWWCICGHIHGLQRNDWCLPPFSDNAGQFKQLAYLCSCPSRKTWSQQGQIMSAVALSLRLWQERRRGGGGRTAGMVITVIDRHINFRGQDSGLHLPFTGKL